MLASNFFNAIVLHRVIAGNPTDFIDIGLTTLRDMLGKKEYNFISIEGALKEKVSLKSSICLTFDDGFSSDYNLVLPELKKINATATFFIVTDFLDTPNYLTKKQVKYLSDEGMQIGSHSKSHPNFLMLAPDKRLEELNDSKEILEDIIGKPISTFAFPYGLFDNECSQAVFLAGYSICCTSEHGLSSKESSMVRRNSINAQTSMKRIDKIFNAGFRQRLVWYVEDRVKVILKRYFPSIYMIIRDFVSKL
jgi:peptidoglycan/xylan/chitin deacetylase (PgdA/CDA1 family)